MNRILALSVFMYTTLMAQAQLAWTPLQGPSGLLSINPSVSASGILFLNKGSANKFDISSNDGETWTSHDLPQPTTLYPNEFIQQINDQTYILFDKRLYAFRKNIQEWQYVTGFDDSEHAWTDSQNRIWSLQQDGKLYYSADEGQHITVVFSDAVNNPLFAMHNDEHNLMVVRDLPSNHVYHFNVDGQKLLIPFNINNFNVEWIQYNPYTGTAYMKTNDIPFNVKKSSDGGITWVDVTFPPDFPAININRIMFTNTGETWAVTGVKAIISKDEGNSWDPFPALDANDYYAQGLLNVSANGQKVLHYTYTCGRQSFDNSLDHGSSWKDLMPKALNPEISRIVKNAAGTIFAEACRRNNVEVSNDEGNTWKSLIIPYNNGTVEPSYICKAPDETLYAPGFNTVFRSSNGGASWEALPFNVFPIGPYHRMVAGSDGTVYAFHNTQGAAFSIDKGEHWEKMQVPGEFIYALYFKDHFDPNGNFYRCSDYYFTQFNPNTNSYKGIVNPGQGTIEAFTVTQTGRIILISTDLVLFTQTMYYSDDEGNSFKEAGQTLEWSIPARLFSGSGMVLMQLNGNYYKSSDNGLTWQLYFKDSAFPATVNTLYFSPDNYLYAGLIGDVIYRTDEKVLANKETAENSNAIYLYPNPVSERLYLQTPRGSDQLRVDVYNMQGQKILDKKLNPGEGLDVSALPNAWYTLIVLDINGLEYTGRFMVAK